MKPLGGDIYFYGRTKGRVNSTYRFLSNFYAAPITINGIVYPTVEHYFQAQKHVGTPLEDHIRLAATPMAAKKLAYTQRVPADWESRKERIMLEALRVKFTQHPDLQQKLLATGSASLHEDSPQDLYWGVKGKDRLGILLMQVREEIRSHSP